MDYLWIIISVFAALMQAVRTAAQKTLVQTLSTLGTTYVRSLVGLPIMVAYLLFVVARLGGGLPPLDAAPLGEPEEVHRVGRQLEETEHRQRVSVRVIEKVIRNQVSRRQ